METSSTEKTNLVDIYGLVIDQSLPKDEKLLSAVSKVRDPRCFKCKGVTVTSRFDKDAPPLETHVRHLFS